MNVHAAIFPTAKSMQGEYMHIYNTWKSSRCNSKDFAHKI